MKNEKDKSFHLLSVPLKHHKDKNKGHWHVILETFSGHHVSVGTTSQAKKGKKATGTNYSCENDILGNGKNSFLRRKGTVDSVDNYFENKTGKMSEKDYKQAQIYGARAKKKFLEQRKSDDQTKHLSKRKHQPASKRGGHH
ncbi:MAG: hypothetical protein J6D15_03830 [Clostridia bacterium]|nr:hypothetical protein [Clostridia bacterium]